jgi:hypothetical protein
MKIQIRFTETYRRVTAAMLAALMLAAWNVPAAEPGTNVTTQTFGSGRLYKTTVERQTEGELSADDLHQASLLTSQLLTHLNAAAQQLADGRGEAARPAIEKAESLVKVVRGLLPATTVTTVTRDAQGKEIYRDVQRVQDDQIPIFEGQIAVEAVEPIVDAKKDEAALKGLKLADADLIHTAVLVDLSYVERKLKRAGELLAKPKEAAEELAQAQSQGVRFFARREDSPLVDVQRALRLADRQVREKKYEGAKVNLQLAKLGLETYRTLVGEEAGKSVVELQNDIQKLSGELQKPESEGKIRGMWEKVAGWFKRESGQAVTTQPSPAKEQPKS